MEDRKPGIAIWVNPGVVPLRTPAGALGCITALERSMVHVNWRICFGNAMPTCMGDHESLEAGGVLVEGELKWKWLRYAHRWSWDTLVVALQFDSIG